MANYVPGSAQSTSETSDNQNSLEHTHETVKAAQDGNTAIIWILTIDGNSNNIPWTNDEGMDALLMVDSDTYGDDIAIYIEFPSWSSAGTAFTRKFRRVDDTLQMLHIISLEVENIDTTGMLHASVTQHSQSVSSHQPTLETTLPNTLLVSISALSTGNLSVSLNGFTNLFSFLTGTNAAPKTTVDILEAPTPDTYDGPIYTPSSTTRLTVAMIALKSKPKPPPSIVVNSFAG